ncbi:uncharacterized protein PFL1_03950 [Pseudozyma flocculosa PF-1]|uniref:Related to MCH4 - monocarboxylate transporter n=2 Tax=Pseudozyma flocculosa TaxID=84751 RepID=A0A5C3EWG8_9BASI|nr:uncharacterized protein PFL1_03950 [Pseudozyma flocculosa PF-1]EPQ28647.1 hypothetical protein PFL1_03950 [Pseudozyma flocculosa PF-1]SPO36593.1 related to MCH4 - monocarboxylate transporter [Pseudozyma flocculosa]
MPSLTGSARGLDAPSETAPSETYLGDVVEHFKHKSEAEDAVKDESSTISTAAPAAPAAPPAQLEIPDGGLAAWLQVVASFFLFFNSWGLVNTYGAFQTYYETALLERSGSSAISWIGSIQASLLLIVGPFSGPLFDLGYVKTLTVGGTVLIVVGMMTTSVATYYYQVLLAQGICTGLGMGAIFIPSIAVLPAWFSSRRAFAAGISVCGSSLGGIVYPIVFRRLEPRIGFAWTTRVIAFVVLATQAVAIALMRKRGPNTAARSLIDTSAFTEPAMLSFGIAGLLAFMGLYVPFYYISSYSVAKIPGMDGELAFYLVPLLNAGSVIGRIIPNFLADKTGSINMFVVSCVGAAITAWAWLTIDRVWQVVVFSIFYGAFSGSYVSLQGPAVAMLTKDKSRFGVRLGTFCLFCAAGMLVGNPVAGKLLNLDTGDFRGAQIFCASLIVAATAFMVATRFFCVGTAFLVKV